MQNGLVHIAVDKTGIRIKCVVGVETELHINPKSLLRKIPRKKALIILSCLVVYLCLIPIARKINSFYRQEFEKYFYLFEPGYVPELEPEEESSSQSGQLQDMVCP